MAAVRCVVPVQDGGVEVNAVKAEIDSLTEQLEVKQAAAGSGGSTCGEPGVLDDDHYPLLGQLKAAKARWAGGRACGCWETVVPATSRGLISLAGASPVPADLCQGWGRHTVVSCTCEAVTRAQRALVRPQSRALKLRATRSWVSLGSQVPGLV